MPKDRHRFSMMDLLVAITLVGALVGLLKGLAGEDKYGLPYKYRGKGGFYQSLDSPTQEKK